MHAYNYITYMLVRVVREARGTKCPLELILPILKSILPLLRIQPHLLLLKVLLSNISNSVLFTSPITVFIDLKL